MIFYTDLVKYLYFHVFIHTSRGQANIHLFPPNLGGSARILDIVHPISAVRHISQ